jgi:transcriptional regulator with XRE-family HTH domain
MDILDSLLDQALANDAARPAAIAKLNYSHDGMIDLIIANRGISQNDIAKQFGYSASWVSQVMTSDAFQSRLAERTLEIVDPTLRATVKEHLQGILARSMELLKIKLSGEPNQVPDQLVIRSVELSSRALGYGARESGPTVQVNIGAHLEEHAANLTALLRRKKSEALDVEFGVAADPLPAVLPHPLPVAEVG